MTLYLPDVNVLLALVLDAHPHHPQARAWFEALDRSDEVALCRASQQSLLRLLSTRAIFAPLGALPQSNEKSWAVCDLLLTDPTMRLQVREPSGIERLWRRYSSTAQASPKRWMDAYLAAFAAALPARFVTFESAFATYDGLDAVVLPTD